jgi:hypothetical protein
MTSSGRLSVVFTSLVVCICSCKAGTQPKAAPANQTQAATPITTIEGPQGGRIVYGTVSGATTQPAAITKLLSGIHSSCGEKPQIGRVLQFRGTNAVGVFFTVTDHVNGNKRIAGLVIAAATGPSTAEAALLSDDAFHFGTSVNPMLQQLFTAWHPGGAPAAGAANASTAQAGRTPTAGPAALHRVALPDRSASVAIPDGWNIMSSTSGGGTINVLGPNKEIVMMNLTYLATDPNNPQVRQLHMMAQQYGQRYQDKTLYYPYGTNLAKAWGDIHHWGDMSQNIHPSFDFQVKTAERVASQELCAHMTGTATLEGSPTTWEFDTVYCEHSPTPGGIWMSTIFSTMVPVERADSERATVSAIEQSFAKDDRVINGQANAIAAPAIAAIHAIGEQATARYNATQAANDAQHAQYWAQQDSNARSNQGFSNYLLDQTVVQNNYTGEHGTAWNSTADALVKADPNKYSYVNTPNYIPGTDY